MSWIVDDMWVFAQAAHRLRFAVFAGQAGLVQPLGLDHGDGHIAFETAVVGQVDALGSPGGAGCGKWSAAAIVRLGGAGVNGARSSYSPLSSRIASSANAVRKGSSDRERTCSRSPIAIGVRQ